MRRRRIAEITGPSGSSAGEPRASCRLSQSQLDRHQCEAGRTHLVALEGDAEENDALEALLDERGEEALEAVQAPAGLSGQGGDLDVRVGVVRDEDGVHKHGLGKRPLRLPGAREWVVVPACEDGAVEAVGVCSARGRREGTHEMSMLGLEDMMTFGTLVAG